MGVRLNRRTLARFKKRVKKSRDWLLVGGVVILASMTAFNLDNDLTINDTAYVPLLSVIAKGESGGNYNAHYGSPANSSIRFTDMTITEVLRWQDDFVNQGNVSSAVGKYQIIKPTLIDITSKMGVDHNERFDETLQDKIAIALIERRGSLEYVNSELSREDFAANLSKEWAALPHVGSSNPSESYYAGDGVNQALVSANEVYDAIEVLEKAAKEGD